MHKLLKTNFPSLASQTVEEGASGETGEEGGGGGERVIRVWHRRGKFGAGSPYTIASLLKKFQGHKKGRLSNFARAKKFIFREVEFSHTYQLPPPSQCFPCAPMSAYVHFRVTGEKSSAVAWREEQVLQIHSLQGEPGHCGCRQLSRQTAGVCVREMN